MENLINDDAQQWYDSLGQDIQDFEVPPIPDSTPTPEQQQAADQAAFAEQHPYADAPRVSSSDATSVLNLQRINRPTASIIVGVMDVVLPIVIALIFKGSQTDNLKLQDDERDTLTDAWAVYLGDKNVQASPTAVLITTIATIYGSKLIIAWQQNKETARQNIIDQQQAELLRLQNENELLKRAAQSAQSPETKA